MQRVDLAGQSRGSRDTADETVRQILDAAVVTFETLRPLLSSMRLTAAPQRARSNFINGMKHLEVAVG